MSIAIASGDHAITGVRQRPDGCDRRRALPLLARRRAGRDLAGRPLSAPKAGPWKTSGSTLLLVHAAEGKQASGSKVRSTDSTTRYARLAKPKPAGMISDGSLIAGRDSASVGDGPRDVGESLQMLSARDRAEGTADAGHVGPQDADAHAGALPQARLVAMLAVTGVDGLEAFPQSLDPPHVVDKVRVEQSVLDQRRDGLTPRDQPLR
jgi:hypothetical protein